MIKLETLDFCHNCPEFEANVDKNAYTDGYSTRMIDTTITCRHVDRCLNMMNYIINQTIEMDEQR